MDVNSAGLGDLSELEDEGEGEVKMTLVLSLIDSKGSDALNEIGNVERKRGSLGFVYDVCF